MLYASGCNLMSKSRQRIFITVALIVGVVVFGAFPLLHEFRKLPNGASKAVQAPVADDVSRLNATAIHEVWDIPGDESTAQSALRELLRQAGSSGMHVSIAGARHSMGGQTISPGGIRVNMLPLKSMELEENSDLLHVDAGALWADVIPYLDRHGRSVE